MLDLCSGIPEHEAAACEKKLTEKGGNEIALLLR